MLEGVKVDGRQFRKPGCEHVWVDSGETDTHLLSRCSLCKRVKKRKHPRTMVRGSYRPRITNIGTNVAGVPFHRNKNLTPLPVAFRGLNTVRA